MEYEVLSMAIELRPPLVVELEPTQVSGRRHALRALGDRAFEILTPIQFKRGECLGLRSVPKYLHRNLSPRPGAPPQGESPASPPPPPSQRRRK